MRRGLTVLIDGEPDLFAGALDLTVTVPYSESISWTNTTLANGAMTGSGAGYTGQIVLVGPKGQEHSGWCVDLFHTVGIAPTRLPRAPVSPPKVITAAEAGDNPEKPRPATLSWPTIALTRVSASA